MTDQPFETLVGYNRKSDAAMLAEAEDFLSRIRTRRTVRDFSTQAVDVEIVRRCIEAAGRAPNGANLQPWHFAIVSNPDVKARIRVAAEQEEREFYSSRAPDPWLEALAPLGTDENKPFLETAPHLVVVFGEAYRISAEGEKQKNYYVSESVGIATGFLIAALHFAGLATLTHTPSPMKFLNRILGLEEQFRPFLVLIVGHPAENAQVPKIQKKPLGEIVSEH